MERILVIGSGGAGKSRLSAEIGARLHLPVVHLDTLYWHPGWVETSAEEWARIVAAEISRPAWVMDGNYGGTMEMRLAACDTVIFLQLSRWLCLWRVIARRIRHQGRSRPDMREGCPEQLDFAFLKWIWQYPASRTPRILERLARMESSRRIFILKSRREVASFLASLPGLHANLSP